jgi:hypothetical protein
LDDGQGLLKAVDCVTHLSITKRGSSPAKGQFSLAELLQNVAGAASPQMETEEIFYTDGQDIVVTLSTLQVRDRFYSLKSIRKHSMAILQPARLPGIILFITGVALALCGMANAFPVDWAYQTGIFERGTDTNAVAQWAGTALTVLGLVLTVVLRERYAVRISTEDGEQDAVVSTRREYIREILDALNRAYMMTEMNTHPRLRRI